MNTRTILLAIALLQCGAQAQPVHGIVTGMVTDAAREPVAGAQVQLVQIETNRQRTAVTGVLGEFTIYSLPPGAYWVGIGRDGYRGHVHQITLLVNQEARLEVALLAGRRTDTVEVTACPGKPNRCRC